MDVQNWEMVNNMRQPLNSYDNGITPLPLFMKQQGAKLIPSSKEIISEDEIVYGYGFTDGTEKFWTLYKQA